MVSVVIPAHNKEHTIGHCLEAMIEGSKPGELEIIVVCNDCSDQTAQVARSFGDSVRVIETSIVGKSHALNVGDRAARFFPRFYVDADVVVTIDALRSVTRAMRDNGTKVAAPRPTVELQRRPWAVRAYYDIWHRLPYCQSQMVGSGIYVLSDEGRQRFVDFPDVLAEDEFVRLSFDVSERHQVDHCRFVIHPPPRLRDLWCLRLRWQISKHQLGQRFSQLLDRDRRDYGRAILGITRRPRLWPCFVVYSFIVVTARIAGRIQIQMRSNPWAWWRDEAGRNDRETRYRGVLAADATSPEAHATRGASR